MNISPFVKQYRKIWTAKSLSLLGVVCLLACQPTSPTSNSAVLPANQIHAPKLSKLTEAEAQQERESLDAKLVEFMANLASDEFPLGSINPALEQFAAQQVNHLRKTASKVDLSGEFNLPVDTFTELSAVVIAVNAPDGSNIVIGTADPAGRFRFKDIPTGMRLDLVATTSSGLELGRALVDIPLNTTDTVELVISPESTVLADAVWLASRDGRSGLESISISQLNKHLQQEPSQQLALTKSLSLLSLTNQIQADIAAEAEQNLQSFQTQSVFKRAKGCAWRIWQNPRIGGFRTLQSTPSTAILSPEKVSALIDKMNGLEGRSPTLEKLLIELKSNSNSSELLLDTLTELVTLLKKNHQVLTARLGQDLRTAGTTNLKPDLINVIGRVGDNACNPPIAPLSPSLIEPLKPAPVISLDKNSGSIGDTITVQTTDTPIRLADYSILFGDIKGSITGLSFEVDEKGAKQVKLQVKVPPLKNLNPVAVRLDVKAQPSSNSVMFNPKAGINQVTPTTVNRGEMVTLDGVFSNNHKIILTESTVNSKITEIVPERVSDTQLRVKIPTDLMGSYRLMLDSDKSEASFKLNIEPRIKIITTQVQNSSDFVFEIDQDIYVEYLQAKESTDRFYYGTSNSTRAYKYQSDLLGDRVTRKITVTLPEQQFLGEMSLFLDSANRFQKEIKFNIFPEITKIEPLKAMPNQKIFIQGRFDLNKSNNIVKFGNVVANIDSVEAFTDSVNQFKMRCSPSRSDCRTSKNVPSREVRLKVTVPEGLEGKFPVTVSNNGYTSESREINLTNTLQEVKLLEIQDRSGKKLSQQDLAKLLIGSRIKLLTSPLNTDKVFVNFGDKKADVLGVNLGAVNAEIEVIVPPVTGSQAIRVEVASLKSNSLAATVLKPNLPSILPLATGIRLVSPTNLPSSDSLLTLFMTVKTSDQRTLFGQCRVAERSNWNCNYPNALLPGKYNAEFIIAKKQDPENDAQLFMLSQRTSFDYNLELDNQVYTFTEKPKYAFRLNGRGFSPQTQVKLASGQALTSTFVSPTELKVVIPFGIWGNQTLQVSAGDQTRTATLQLPSLLEFPSGSPQMQQQFTLKGYRFSDKKEENIVIISPFKTKKDQKGKEVIYQPEVVSVTKSASFEVDGLMEMQIKLTGSMPVVQKPAWDNLSWIWVKTKEGVETPTPVWITIKN